MTRSPDTPPEEPMTDAEALRYVLSDGHMVDEGYSGEGWRSAKMDAAVAQLEVLQKRLSSPVPVRPSDTELLDVLEQFLDEDALCSVIEIEKGPRNQVRINLVRNEDAETGEPKGFTWATGSTIREAMRLGLGLADQREGGSSK